MGKAAESSCDPQEIRNCLSDIGSKLLADALRNLGSVRMKEETKSHGCKDPRSTLWP
jgi:hypothetical protein